MGGGKEKSSFARFETAGVITTLIVSWSTLLRWFLKQTICRQQSFGSQLTPTSICSFLFIFLFCFSQTEKNFFFYFPGCEKRKIFVNCPVVAPAFCFLYFCCLAQHRGGDTVTCSLSFSLSVSLLSTSFVFRRVSSRHGLGDMLVHRPAPPICYPRRSLGAVIYAARRPHRTDPSSAWQSCR